MSILTKISIVVLVVVVLLACPVFITQATVAPNFRDLHQAEVKRSKLFEQQAVYTKLALELSEQQAERARMVAVGEKQALETRIKQLEFEEAKLSVAMAALQARLASLDEQLMFQLKLAEADKSRADRLDTQAAADRQQIRTLIETTSRQNSALRSEQVKNESARRIVRDLKEQVAALERDKQDLETRLRTVQVATGPGQKGPAKSVARVEGVIEAVEGTIASINVGKAHGVVRGQRLVVYRGDDFIAYLTIGEVHEDHAAGTISDKEADVVKGDRVTSDATLTAAAGG